jgi:hypothetical protein
MVIGNEIEGNHDRRNSVRHVDATVEQEDYCGVPLDDWKKALRKDVSERFGPIPDDLKPTGEPGW